MKSLVNILEGILSADYDVKLEVKDWGFFKRIFDRSLEKTHVAGNEQFEYQDDSIMSDLEQIPKRVGSRFKSTAKKAQAAFDKECIIIINPKGPHDRWRSKYGIASVNIFGENEYISFHTSKDYSQRYSDKRIAFINLVTPKGDCWLSVPDKAIKQDMSASQIYIVPMVYYDMFKKLIFAKVS